jgi:hypothetical protein
MLRAFGLWMFACAFSVAYPVFAATLATAGGNAPEALFVSLVQFRFNIASSMPAGSVLTCKAEIVPDDGWARQLTPIERASGTTTLRGAIALCALEIPFSWAGNQALRICALRYEINGISPTGAVVVLKGLCPAITLAPSPAGVVVNLHIVGAP